MKENKTTNIKEYPEYIEAIENIESAIKSACEVWVMSKRHTLPSISTHEVLDREVRTFILNFLFDQTDHLKYDKISAFNKRMLNQYKIEIAESIETIAYLRLKEHISTDATPE